MNRAAFFTSVRATLFGGRLKPSQVGGMERILNECEAQSVTDKGHVAYILATAYHETAFTMQPVTEYGSEKYLKGKKYWPYVGRGYVQLTWDFNYRDWGKRLGLDLLKNPDLAKDPKIAARILVQGMILGTFTGKKLTDYINGPKRDFVRARRVINGSDKAALIARHAGNFLKAL